MDIRNLSYSLLVFLLMFVSCQFGEKQKINESISPQEVGWQYPEYAKGFRWRTSNQTTELEILQPWFDAKESLIYELSPEPNSKKRSIQIPISSIASSSTSHIPMLTALGKGQSLIAFSQSDLISDALVRNRINQGLVEELGNSQSINLEKLMVVKPDLMMTFVMDPSARVMHKMEQLGIDVFVSADYLEHTPLGRAEWVKVMGMLFDENQKADSIFSAIEQNYLDLKQLASTATDQPSTFANLMYGDIWYMPGGNSYPAGFFADAHSSYIWQNDSSSTSLPLNYETVLTKAQSADYWIGVANNTNKEQLLALNQNYASFAAFQNDKVFHYHKQVGPTGGNEYLELGFLRPDLILKDLIKVLHPELLPEHELYFYGQLQ